MAGSSAVPHLLETENATTRYLAALTDLTDAEMRAPSLLPGWSRGHLVTHLSRNADGLCNLLHWATTGIESYMYPSQEARDADIEAGAGRSAEELREDASASAGRFLQAANQLDVAHLDAIVARTPGAPTFKARTVLLLRRIEVEVHHADLDIGFTHRDWDQEFAETMLDRAQRDRQEGPAMVLKSTDSGRVWKYGGQGQGPQVSGTSTDLAWWVLGRGDGDGLATDVGVLPILGPWR
jgi:maleylpyruvate isomerase